MRIEGDIVKTAVIVGLLCTVYGGMVFWPSEKQNKAMAAEIQSKQDELVKRGTPDLAPLRAEIVELRAELRESAIELPSGESPFRVLDSLSEAITSNGVTLYDTSQRKSERYARFAVTPVDVQFSCRFDQAFKVLRTIESSRQPIRIERMEMTGSKDETTGFIDVNMQMSSFFTPSAKQGGRP